VSVKVFKLFVVLVLILLISAFGFALEKVTFSESGSVEINYCSITLNNQTIELSGVGITLERIQFEVQQLYEKVR
jgi:hypothetical protein